MMVNHPLSDQLYTWSDNAKQIDIFITPPSQDITAPTAASRASIARLTHRTLQAQYWLENRFQYQFERTLYHTVPNARDGYRELHN